MSKELSDASLHRHNQNGDVQLLTPLLGTVRTGRTEQCKVSKASVGQTVMMMHCYDTRVHVILRFGSGW